MTEKIAYIIEPGYRDCEKEKQVLSPLGYTVEFLNWHNDLTILRESMEKAHLVFVRDTELDKTTIEHMHHVKGIVRYGVGVDAINIEAASQKGIVVTRVPDYGAEIEVADHALAMILGLKRRLMTRDIAVRNGAWNIAQQEPMERIANATLGLLGYGKIARAVAFRMRAFGVTNVVVYDPYLERDYKKIPNKDQEQSERRDFEFVTLDELAKRSDILSLHAPSTIENYRIINAPFLSLMKPNAILINTSRGRLIDEEALYKALNKGLLQGAGLDVFEQEPPMNSPLFTLKNIILSDHTAWYSESSVEMMQALAAEQARQIVVTGTATNRIN